ncbi:MAG: SpoIIE family protein phosphatase [Terracidiphilus sp.]
MRSIASLPSPATPSFSSPMEFSTLENEKEEMYGEERLAGLLCASREMPAAEIAEAILADVTRFQGTHDRFDDETIIVLRVR